MNLSRSSIASMTHRVDVETGSREGDGNEANTPHHREDDANASKVSCSARIPQRLLRFGATQESAHIACATMRRSAAPRQVPSSLITSCIVRREQQQPWRTRKDNTARATSHNAHVAIWQRKEKRKRRTKQEERRKTKQRTKIN